GDDYHGHWRSVAFGHTWNHVGSAATAGGLGDARFVRQAGVAIGHNRRRALVSCHDVRDLPSSSIERVVEHHRGIAWYSKDMLNPVFLEQFDQNLGGIHHFSSCSFYSILKWRFQTTSGPGGCL